MKRMTLEEVHALSLEMLKDIHAFCTKNGIRYFGIYGTLIGAVRHKGFIPWDDDIDLMMPRGDYERFRREYRSDRFSFISRETSEDVYIAFGRVVETEKTVCLMDIPWHSGRISTGVFVDIFPLDAAPDDRESFDLLFDVFSAMRKRQLKGRSFRAVACPEFGWRKNLSIWWNRRMHPRKGLEDPSEISLQMQYLAGLVGSQKTAHVFQPTCPDSRKVYFPASYFDEIVETPFENTVIMIPASYDKILTTVYGDYMTLPPEDRRFPVLDRFGGIFWK